MKIFFRHFAQYFFIVLKKYPSFINICRFFSGITAHSNGKSLPNP